MERKRKKYELRRDVYVPWQMIESEALRVLSPTGVFVLLRFLQKRTFSKVKNKKKPIYQNSGLVFTYNEAKALGISTSQFAVVMKKLVELGFIDVEHQGGGVGRDYSRYAVSNRWENYGTDLFEKVTKPRRLWRGQDVRSNMARSKKTTKVRSCQLRRSVVIGENGPFQGSGSS